MIRAAADKLGEADEGLCDDMKAEGKARALAASAKQVAVKKPVLKGRLAAGLGVGASSSSSSGGPGVPAIDVVVRPVLEGSAHALEEARTLIPQAVKGCTITMHTDHAWLGRYADNEKGNKSRTKNFDPADMASIFQALHSVLSWIWESHTTLTGELPPFDLLTEVDPDTELDH